MNSTEAKIFQLLQERQVPHEVFEHAPVTTNAAMAAALGVGLDATVKNIMLETAEGEIILAVLPGDKRLDTKRLSAQVGSKRVSFAKPDKVEEIAGCAVGCAPPFGHRQPIRVFVESTLLAKGQVYFNPASHAKSVKLVAADLPKLGPMIPF